MKPSPERSALIYRMARLMEANERRRKYVRTFQRAIRNTVRKIATLQKTLEK